MKQAKLKKSQRKNLMKVKQIIKQDHVISYDYEISGAGEDTDVYDLCTYTRKQLKSLFYEADILFVGIEDIITKKETKDGKAPSYRHGLVKYNIENWYDIPVSDKEYELLSEEDLEEYLETLEIEENENEKTK